MKKLLIFFIFVLSSLYATSSIECNVCYFPRPLSCPSECSTLVPCSAPSGSGYECVNYKGVSYSLITENTIQINFYSTNTCEPSSLQLSQEISVSSYSSSCDPNKCYDISTSCGQQLLQLIQSFPAKEIKVLLPKDIITISLLIIFVEVSALGIVYTLGKAFSYEKLVTYSKGELTQALANIILIGIIFSLLLTMDIYKIFQTLDLQLNKLASDITSYAFLPFLWNTIMSVVESLSFSIEFSIPISIVTVNIGVYNVQPLDGIAPFLDAVDRILSYFSLSYIFIIATRVFFIFIETMLPILLYLGLLLRIIPWTRSAGGYLIAFFISFYFFYPLLLWSFLSLQPFSLITFYSPYNYFNFWYPDVTNLENFAVDVVTTIINILPLILCFIVSLMVVEEFGMLLGSFLTRPSLFRLI
ncbi:MAG: hypothetical protein ACP5HJ_00540 [Candidatus Micrarchaeia archaeon]